MKSNNSRKNVWNRLLYLSTTRPDKKTGLGPSVETRAPKAERESTEISPPPPPTTSEGSPTIMGQKPWDQANSNIGALVKVNFGTLVSALWTMPDKNFWKHVSFFFVFSTDVRSMISLQGMADKGFFNVGLPKESIFLAAIYGLYLGHHYTHYKLHFTSCYTSPVSL